MFKLINGGEKLPQRATKYSAGLDVFANEDAVIGAGETKLIGTGVALDLESIEIKCGCHCGDEMYELSGWDEVRDFMSKHYFALHIRSSLRAKGLTSLGTGIIDMDYSDEIKIVVHNPISEVVVNDIGEMIGVAGYHGFEKFHIKKGDKIGQLILCRHEGWSLSEEYTKDEERNGGFGSTGA